MNRARITIRWNGGRPVFGGEKPADEQVAAGGGDVGRAADPGPRHRAEDGAGADRSPFGMRAAAPSQKRPPPVERLRSRRSRSPKIIPSAVALLVGSLLGAMCWGIFFHGKPEAPETVRTISLYIVQAGAFADQGRAQAAADRLSRSGVPARLVGRDPTLVVVGLAVDPAVPGPLGNELRKLQVPFVTKRYRPPAPPESTAGIRDGRAFAAGLRRNVDILGELVDRWSRGIHDPGRLAVLEAAAAESGRTLAEGAEQLRGAGRGAAADAVSRWQRDVEQCVQAVREGGPASAVMGRLVEAMADYERVIELLASETPDSRPAPGKNGSIR